MGSNTYTEEEFKKVLKTLFAEKKRVKDLQKKFQSKLTNIHHHSIADEHAALKTAYVTKEHAFRELKEKFEKVRPALKKLVEDLKSARAEIEILKTEEKVSHDEELQKELEVARAQIGALEDEKQRLVEKEVGELHVVREQILKLEEELNSERELRSALEKEKHTFDSSIEELKKALVERGGALEQARANEQKESHRFEAERSRLVERLAEGLSQVQRLTEMIKDLREENSALHREYEGGEDKLKAYEHKILDLKEKQHALLEVSSENSELKRKLANSEEEFERERKAFSLQAQEWEVQSKQAQEMSRELKEVRAQLQETDLASVREEYEGKLLEHEKRAQKALDEMGAAHESAMSAHSKETESLIAHLNAHIAEARAERDHSKSEYAALTEQFHQTLEEKEKLLEKSYTKMRELSSRHGEMVEEMEKLSGQLEEKKHQFIRLEKEFGLAQNSVQNAQLENDERESEIRKAQQHLAKKVREATILRDLTEQQTEQIAELQTLDKEWQEKYLALQHDWQEKKMQLQELQKTQENYDQMAATVSSLKNILGKGEEA